VITGALAPGAREAAPPSCGPLAMASHLRDAGEERRKPVGIKGSLGSRGAVPRCLLGRRDDVHLAMADRRHALLECVELGRIALVILGIDHQERGFDLAEIGGRIEVAGGVH
jgi:hypothetical protein